MTPIFKIKHKQTGLYSNGGGWHVKWGKTGKLWNGLGPLRMHLNRVLRNSIKNSSLDIENWEVLEIEMVVKTSKSVADSINPNKLVELLKR